MVSDGVNTRMINSMIIISIIISIIIRIIIIIISRVLWSLVGKMGRKEAAFGRLLHACTICNPIIIVVVVNIIIIIIIIIIIMKNMVMIRLHIVQACKRPNAASFLPILPTRDHNTLLMLMMMMLMTMMMIIYLIILL